MKGFLIACVLLGILACIEAHSWVACTYYTEESGVNYDASKCLGFPRNWEEWNGGGFGFDRGYNFQGTGCGAQNARGNPVSAAYSARYPMAKWKVGSKVCLAWPSKNHVATESNKGYGGATTCANPTNRFIPDGGIKLLRSANPNPTSDPSQAAFLANEIKPFGKLASNGEQKSVSMSFTGFQNCPNFCNNNDKSMCTGCFIVPNIAKGVYSFQWWWVFNPGDPYTTCFDAEIVDGNAAPAPPPATGGPVVTSAPLPTVPPPPIANRDFISITALFPTQIPTTGFFDLVLQYSVGGPRTIITDILDFSNNFKFHGKGTKEVTAGKGIVLYRVTITDTIPAKAANGGITLKSWLVSTSVYKTNPQPWTLEMMKIETPVASGATSIYPNGIQFALLGTPSAGDPDLIVQPSDEFNAPDVTEQPSTTSGAAGLLVSAAVFAFILVLA